MKDSLMKMIERHGLVDVFWNTLTKEYALRVHGKPGRFYFTDDLLAARAKAKSMNADERNRIVQTYTWRTK